MVAFRKACALLVMLAAPGPVLAAPLLLGDALDLARRSEPGYLTARAGVQSAEARQQQALGALLPQLQLSANTAMNRRSYTTLNSPLPEQKDDYNAHVAQATLTHPLWHYVNLLALEQTELAQAQAELQMHSADQELFAKVVSAWFDALAARDELLFARRQAEATRQQWQVYRRGAELGLYSPPQVDEAESRLRGAEADAFAADTDLQLKLAALEVLTGPLPSAELPGLPDAPLDLPEVGSLESWLQAVMLQNPGVMAARKALDAARQEVAKQRAGYMPNVDVVGTYELNNQHAGGFPGQNGYEIDRRAVALQVSMPLYTGGTVMARVREAMAAQEKARQDIEQARRNAELAVKQAWYGWRAGQVRYRAGGQALLAAQSALRVAEAGARRGLKGELDVLQAQQQVAAARRDLGKGAYQQVSAFLRLKSLVGQASFADAASLDAGFVAGESPASTLVPARDSSAAPEAP